MFQNELILILSLNVKVDRYASLSLNRTATRLSSSECLNDHFVFSQGSGRTFLCGGANGIHLQRKLYKKKPFISATNLVTKLVSLGTHSRRKPRFSLKKNCFKCSHKPFPWWDAIQITHILNISKIEEAEVVLMWPGQGVAGQWTRR